MQGVHTQIGPSGGGFEFLVLIICGYIQREREKQKGRDKTDSFNTDEQLCLSALSAFPSLKTTEQEGHGFWCVCIRKPTFELFVSKLTLFPNKCLE